MNRVVANYYLGALNEHYLKILAGFEADQTVFRLWAKDKALFGADAEVMLDWLSGPQDVRESLPKLLALKKQISKRSFSSVVLLGMGGSSLAPLVFKTILADRDEPTYVLDTIHPQAVARVLQEIDIKNTLFIVASKSGTTLESNLLYRYFLQELKNVQVEDCYSHFMAITDPTTPLEQESVECGFLQGPFGKPGIGGRYSVFSAFGIMPALLMDLDIERLLASALSMAESLGPSIAAKDNQGALLGAFLATAAYHQDRLMIHVPPSLSSLGLWLEQLIAESLGKHGKGLVPIICGMDDEHANCSHIYIQLRHDAQHIKLAKNNATAHLVIAEPYDIAALMYCFQISVALAGAALKINPFDQPDVESSKKLTQRMIKELEHEKSPQAPFFKGGVVSPGGQWELAQASLMEFINSVNSNDYIAILSYLDDSKNNAENLQIFANALSKKTSMPIIIQIGPRYLHSTGQLFKGGKNNGNFLIITGSYDHDIKNDHGLMFSDIHLSQARGDACALKENGRRVCHVHVDDKGLEALLEMVAISS
jgi:transaldolase / glucose-6-phosphate isomerase